MNKYKSRLEDLPNELLTDIFKNLDGRNLFRAFYNLNYRLNLLLQSFQYLQLIFHMNQSNVLKTNDEIFPLYIHTLIVSPWINFNLKRFPNVRRLKLNNPLPKILEQLQPNIMPYLEDLSISYTYNMYEMDLLLGKIFSNRFLNLKSCELFKEKSLMIIPCWTQSLSIRILKTGSIDSVTYKTILSACPNLYFFKFWLNSIHGIPTDIQLHKKLKRMIIELREYDSIDNDNTISGFLAYVPNLEQLEIHRKIYSQDIIKDYDWFASIINFRLPILQRFKFYCHLLNNEKLIENIDENILQSDFINIHKGPYKAQLKINREL